MSNLGSKWVRLALVWDKSETFSDQISVYFGFGFSPGFVPFGANLTLFGAQI